MKSRTLRSDIVFTFSLALALILAWYVRNVLLLIYVSALFAVVLTPVVKGIMKVRIGRWSPGRGVAILVLVVVVAGFATMFFIFALPPVARDLREFISELPTRGPQLLARIRKIPLMQRLDVNSLNTRIQDFAANFATYIFLSAKHWASKLFDIITGIVLTVYFMLEGEKAYHWMLSFFPVEMRQRLDKTLVRAEARMGQWLLGQGALMLILGTCSTIVFVALHLRYAYALGVLMGLFNIIPIAGAIITVSLALMVAAIDSWGRVLGVAIFYAIYAQLETSFLTPRIMQSRVDLPGLAIIIALMLGAALDGVRGALVAVPTAVLVAVLLDEYAVQSEPVICGPRSLSEVENLHS
ncbi:AI-2E family transporter [Pseudacidobacterium ailaaui]|jgi:predicted PurR-regulated permease PerM|uniref:AI-2E family transporter n=1 Tax=Pseudacidobacterium ailaaui TaxID=1382359 RepID=UPI0005D2A4DA|nr:AI-2E family transporter [Pseudacidobacterium ailaaui]MCL6464729.1 AI-2E family transporter [Pseudacidobacterium ailaaui]MDI3253765.1 AI-2E family transporter [Bacillota bacterium]